MRTSGKNLLRLSKVPGVKCHDRDLEQARAGSALALRAVQVGMARVRRAVNRAARSPQSLFLRQLVTQPGSVGAICASSPQLAARMAAHVCTDAEGLVIELGGGTGVITAALLAHGVAPERLVVVEQSASLAAHLRRRFPLVHVITGDAAEIQQWHAEGRLPSAADGAARAIDTIVSGLPLLSIPLHVRQRILRAGHDVLSPGGRLLQFTYALRGPSPWQGAGLVRLHSERVLANLPPARIDILGREHHRHAARG